MLLPAIGIVEIKEIVRWLSVVGWIHKVLIYIEHHSVCPLVGIGTPPPLLPQASVPSPADQRVGGHTRLRLKGWGSPNSDDWRKSLALCLLCAAADLPYAVQDQHKPLKCRHRLRSVDTSRSCTALCRVDKSRCCSGPLWCRHIHVQQWRLYRRQV